MRPGDADARDDREWFRDHPDIDFRVRWGAEGLLWAIRCRHAERQGIADVLRRTVLDRPPDTGTRTKDAIAAAWWGATYPYLAPDDRKKIAKDAQKRAKNAKRSKAAKRPTGAADMKTEMERVAIRAARLPLYDGLVKLGIDSAFDSCTAAQIDELIESVWDALRASMQQQSAAGEIPI
jgi:hypothetical protein